MTTIQAATSSPHYIVGVLDDVAPDALVRVGDQMGFYRALDLLGSLTPDELAEYTRLDERYVHDWLHHEATIGHISFSLKTRRFSLTRDQASELKRLGARVDTRSASDACCHWHDDVLQPRT